jgi:hypothetical protein
MLSCGHLLLGRILILIIWAIPIIIDQVLIDIADSPDFLLWTLRDLRSACRISMT